MLIFFLAEAYLPVALRQMTDLNHAPFLKMSWRAQTSLILLLPIALVEAHANGGSGWAEYLSTTSSSLTLLGGLFGVGFSWASSFSLLTASLSHTSLAHATLCAVGALVVDHLARHEDLLVREAARACPILHLWFVQLQAMEPM